MLNQRQTLFTARYLETGNATAAYKEAYRVEDDNVAAVSAYHLLRNPKVIRAIEEHNKKIMEQTKITIEDVVRRINTIADSGKDDYARLKALDMLMKHLGGYVTVSEIIDKMSEQQINELVERITKRGNHETAS